MTASAEGGRAGAEGTAASPYGSGFFDDLLDAEGTVGESRTQYLTPRQLMYMRFCRNKLAIVGFWFLAVLYLAALFAPMVAPYDKAHRFYGHL